MKTAFLSLSTLFLASLVTRPAAAQAPTDPQIAAIVVAANQVDIDAARLVPGRAAAADVKAFAKQMITDHSAVNAAAVRLVTKLHVVPEPSATSRKLTDDGAAGRKTLAPMHGAAFDRAYIGNEVAYHQAVLDAIDKVLIPNAKNAELKALLEQTRPAIAAHLEHAKQIQASLKG
jgi:putative membrane protein